MKLVEPIKIDDGPARLLSAVSESAERGEVTDYAMVYLTTEGPKFSHSYRVAKRAHLIGLLEILKNDLLQFFECETDEPD